MKESSITAFCRLLGVSADTLRYYERRQLLCAARNPDNQYRTYAREDALDIWNLYMLRSLDMRIQDMSELRARGSFREQRAFLHERERALEREIKKLRAKRRRLRQLSALFDLADGARRPRLEESMQGHCAVYVMDGQDKSESISPDLMSAWVSAMPYTYIALSIPCESLIKRPETFQVRVGLGILEGNLDKTDYDLRENAEYTPPQGKNMCLALATGNVFELGTDDLLPLYQEMEARSLVPAGPASGRVVCSSCRAGSPQHLIVLSVPVEPGR